jgi:hypothetical protein
MGITTCSVLHGNIGINASHRPRQCGCAKPKFGMHTSVDRTPPAHGEFGASTDATFAWYRTRMSRIFCINTKVHEILRVLFPSYYPSLPRYWSQSFFKKTPPMDTRGTFTGIITLDVWVVYVSHKNVLWSAQQTTW